MPPPRKLGSPALVPTKETPKKSTTPETIKTLSEVEPTVSYEISITKKVGDFEFIKLTAGVTYPVGATDEMLAQIDKSLEVARERVITRLEEDLKTISL